MKNQCLILIKIVFAWSLLRLCSTLTLAQTEGLYLADNLSNLQNFTTFGHISLAQRPPPLTNQATMKVLGNNLSFLQPKSYLPHQPTLQTYPKYAYNFDFSLKNFQAGDQFNVYLHYFNALDFIFLNCQLETGQYSQRKKLNCRLKRQRQGQNEDIIQYLDYHGQTNEFFTDEEEMTMIIINTSSQFSFFVWAKNQPQFGRSGGIWRPHYCDFSSTQNMQIRLERSLVQNERAELSLHRFFYTSPTYFFQSTIPLLMQTDSQWSQELLGHTRNQTIGQIGCLLTDVAMLFQAQNYHHFPDGRPLNPQSLNQWLKQQRDGYINQNLLNLGAVTRLSNQLQASYAQQNLYYPRFEYHYLRHSTEAGQDFISLLDSANLSQGIIVEIPGHFVISDGINFKQRTKIKDPYFSQYQYLHQHNNSDILSLRRLVPSYTDQSYFMINIIGQAEVSLKKENEVIIPQIAPLYDPLTHEKIGQQFLFPKIDSGTYQLDLQPQNQETKFSFFVYNQDGEVATYAPEELDLISPLTIKFYYDKQASANFYQEETPELSKNEKWQKLLREQNWSYAFISLSLDHWWQKNELPMVKRIAQDYRQRNLLTAFELQEIELLIDE